LVGELNVAMIYVPSLLKTAEVNCGTSGIVIPLTSVACTDGATVGAAVNVVVGSELGRDVSDTIDTDGDRLASPTGCIVGEPVETLLENVGV